MKPLPVVAHLGHAEARRRYRACPDAREKTRWHLVWLLLKPGGPANCERAAPLVGLSDVHARAVLRRWNADGPAALADGRKRNASAGRLTPAQRAELFDALKGRPADGGLWSGPKVAAFARERFGVDAHPATEWRWLRKLGFRLVVPRPKHPGAATADEQRRWL